MKLKTSPTISVPRKVARRMAWTLALASIAHPTAAGLAIWDWRLDLIAHFREPALALSLIASASMIPIRRAVAASLGLLALWQAWGLSACSWPNPIPADSSSTARLRVISANLLVHNEQRDPLIRLVRLERPEILGLIEVSRVWIDELEPIRSDFPYRWDFPNDENGTGLALWCRNRPISVELIEPPAEGGLRSIHAVIDFAGKSRHLWLIHFVSPLDRPDKLAPGREFAVLAEQVRRVGGSSLAMGDFNSTDGSPYFARFLRDSGLRDSRLGFGRQGSWPTWSPYRIAIDHAFVSPDIAVENRRLGPSIGSDHFPMILELAPAASVATNDVARASQSSGELGSSAANLTRSTNLRNSTSRSSSTGPSFSTSVGSSPISSVVFEPQAGPNAPIRASRTTSDEAINR